MTPKHQHRVRQRQRVLAVVKKPSHLAGSWMTVYRRMAEEFDRLRGHWPVDYKTKRTQRLDGYRGNWREELSYVLGDREERPATMGRAPFLMIGEVVTPSKTGSWAVGTEKGRLW